MKKSRILSFMSGVVTSFLVMSLIVSCLAISGRMTIQVDPINVQVNGQIFQPKDVNGADVPVFSYNGTTYAPLRALAEAYGLQVGYDSVSNMAVVTKPGEASAVNPLPVPSTNSNGELVPIGRPGEGLSEDFSILGGALSFTQNSVGGLKLLWAAKNNSGKTINYYDVHLKFENPVGDPAYDEITGMSTSVKKYVGPVEPGGMLVIYSVVGYSWACSKIIITDIDVQYADGTTQNIPYWFSANEVIR